jgi:DNA (cytosine-5)-methyltransferase 1
MNKQRQLFTSYHELAKKNDNRRIWLEGEPLIRAGFKPGDFFEVSLNVNTLAVTLHHVPDSQEARARHKKGEVRKVSRRNMGDWIKPIVDICNADITALFGEFAKFRAQAFAGMIVFSVHPEDLKRAQRESRAKRNLKAGFLTKGDAFLGFGISASATTQGFGNEGIKAKQLWAVEMEARYLDIAVQNSPEMYADAHLFCGKVEEIEKDLLEPVDVFSFSMECTNHSTQGKTKKKLKIAEMGEGATSLFGVVEMIKAANPAILISENVVGAKDSASYLLLKAEIKRLGYTCHEMILTQDNSGSLDRRRRYWFVAYSSGLNVNVDAIMPTAVTPIHERFGDIMEEVTDPKAWHATSKLEKREALNLAAGRNFTMKRADPDSTVINTIPRNYTKHQVSNPHVFSKDNKQYRLITKTEHAHMKRVPPRLIMNCSNTTAHEGLGQGIAYMHGVSVAESMLRALSLNDGPQKSLLL